MDDKVPSVCVYGFHILDVICPIIDYFKSLRTSDSEADVDYLEEYLNEIKKDAKELFANKEKIVLK